MDKFCIFCGNKPQSKNLEHIIPQWLLKMTGDPKRKVSFGIDWRKPGIETHSFSYNQFKFPSCEECNTKFGRLESTAKPIVEKILNNDSLSGNEISVFLEWLDKIRVGLWLAYYYLDKNILDISPQYHISKRTGLYDRMVAVYKADDSTEGVGFIGANTPSFQYSPTCYTLVINSYHFFNLSTFFLFSRRLGFPHAKKITYQNESHKYEIDIDYGKKRMMYPLIRKSIMNHCVQLYQPVFNRDQLGNEIINEYYDNDYVRQNSLNWDEGKGCIFYHESGAVKKYNNEACVKSWMPEKNSPRELLAAKLAAQTYDFQTYLLENDPIHECYKIKGMAGIKKQLKHAKKINEKFKLFANKRTAT